MTLLILVLGRELIAVPRMRKLENLIRMGQNHRVAEDIDPPPIRCHLCEEKGVVGEIRGIGPDGYEITIGWLHRDGKECVPNELRELDQKLRARKDPAKTIFRTKLNDGDELSNAGPRKQRRQCVA